MSVRIEDLSNSIKKNFVKDLGLPIQIFREPYFTYFLKLYDPITGSWEAFQKFVTMLNFIEEWHGEEWHEQYFQQSQRFREQVIDFVKSRTVYNRFNDFPMEMFKPLHNLTKDTFYQEKYAHQYHVSIDIKEACFQVIRAFDERLVDFADSYKELTLRVVDSETFDEYFAESKNIRQVIFGNLNAKRQVTMQKYYISIIMDELYKAGFDPEQIISSSSDEVIVHSDQRDSIKDILDNSSRLKNINLHVDRIYLDQIEQGYPYFVKKYDNGKVEFKNVPTHFMAQCYKRYYGMELNDYDMMFYFENMIASFHETLFTDD